MLARIQLSSPVRRGQPMEVRLLVQHPMETGFRFDVLGTSAPKNVIHSLQASYGARTVFRARLGSGISANPYLQFWVVPEESGELLVQWQDDMGQKGEVRARVDVTPA
jgi:thiosulfate oxidation carrier complex protein SoxZ